MRRQLYIISGSHACIVRQFIKADKELIGYNSKQSSIFIIRYNYAPEMVENVTYQGQVIRDIYDFYVFMGYSDKS